MAATIVLIAQEVVDELNEGGFSRGFTAKRGYLPIFDLKEMSGLHVTVVPASKTTEIENKKWKRGDYGIFVSVQQRVCVDSGEQFDKKEIDDLVALTEDIESRFFFKKLEFSGNTAWCVATANEPVYSAEHLEEKIQFTSVITLTFRTHLT